MGEKERFERSRLLLQEDICVTNTCTSFDFRVSLTAYDLLNPWLGSGGTVGGTVGVSIDGDGDVLYGLGVESRQPKVTSGGTVISELQMDQRYQI